MRNVGPRALSPALGILNWDPCLYSQTSHHLWTAGIRDSLGSWLVCSRLMRSDCICILIFFTFLYKQVKHMLGVFPQIVAKIQTKARRLVRSVMSVEMQEVPLCQGSFICPWFKKRRCILKTFSNTAELEPTFLFLISVASHLATKEWAFVKRGSLSCPWKILHSHSASGSWKYNR